MYQVNDIVKSIEPKMATLFGKDKAYKEINEYYQENENKKQKNEYTNILKRNSSPCRKYAKCPIKSKNKR